MPTITATAFPVPAYVLVQVDWTDFPDVTHATVTRRNTVTGETVTLRPYTSFNSDGYLALNCGLGLWWDTEPPLNVPLEYCTIAADVDIILSSNPDFEIAAAPWTATGGAVVRSAVYVHTGTFSGELTPTGTSVSTQAANNVAFSFVANVPVVMSAWTMSPQGWNAVHIEVLVQYDNGIVETISGPIEILDNNEERYLVHTFTPAMAGQVTSFRYRVDGAPPATTLFYFDDIQVVQAQPIATTVCDTVTVTSESLWLKNPLNPCLDVEIGLCDPMYEECGDETRVSYAGMSAETRPANTLLSEPVNRIYPIPTNRQRRGPRSTLNLITHDCDARDAVIAANQPGDPLLFQAPATYCIPDRYISVGELGETRLSVDQREDFRLMTLPYAVVERPVGPANAPCGIAYEDLCDIYASWQSMTLNSLDYEDLLLGTASNDSPTNPLPDAARTWDDVEAEFVDWDAVEAGGTRDWDELRDGL